MRQYFLSILVAVIFSAYASADGPEYENQDWCYTYDFTTSDYGFSPSIGSWESGVGFQTGLISPSNPDKAVGIDYTHGTTVTPNFVVLVIARVTPNVAIEIESYGTVFGVSSARIETLAAFTDPLTLIFEPGSPGENGTDIDTNIQTDLSTVAIQSLELRGNGITPFSTNACGAPPPTATSAPTNTSVPTATSAPTDTSAPGTPTATSAPTNTSAPGAPTLAPATNTTVPPRVSSLDCTTANPCGPVPWKIPQLPRMLTPTSVPNSSGTVGSVFGPTPISGGQSASLGDTSFFDGDALNEQIGVLGDLMSNQNTLNGTGQDLGALVGQSGDFFGYLRSFSTANFGVFTPILQIFILSFGIKLSLGISTRLFPVLIAIYGFVRKAITVILDFIPL